MSELLSFRKAAERIGWKGRAGEYKLLRVVFSKEKESGKQIATRFRGPKKTNCRVTISALRRHCPELFKSKVDELSENMRDYLHSIDTRIAEAAAAHVARHVEPRLDELWGRDEVIADKVDELGQRVTQIAALVTATGQTRTA